MYIFDTYHRNPYSILKDIDRFRDGRRIILSKWPNPIQRDDKIEESNICGQLSLAWLLLAQHFGVRNAILI